MKRLFIYGFLIALILELPLWYDHSREVTFYYLQAQELQYLSGNRANALPWCLTNPKCDLLTWMLWDDYMSALMQQVQDTQYVQVNYLTKAYRIYLW